MTKKDGKKKPMMALVISVGPKMPKKPEDTATPDDKAMKKAWDFMKENEARQMSLRNYPTDDDDVRYTQSFGPSPPILSIQEQLRRQEEREKLRRQNASELTDALFGSEGEFD